MIKMHNSILVLFQVLGNLQTCSRSELIAMVLSMQRETESLREQIKTLTGLHETTTITKPYISKVITL